jgi:hypothetical protein
VGDRAVGAAGQGELARAVTLGALAALLERTKPKTLSLYLSIRNWLQIEEGQDPMECALLITCVLVVMMTSVALPGGTPSDYYTEIAPQVEALLQ